MLQKKQTFNTALTGIEKLGEKWLKENIGIHRRIIVANTQLTAKITHRASVNGISRDMKAKVSKKIKDFIWGGRNKTSRVRWEIMTKKQKREEHELKIRALH